MEALVGEGFQVDAIIDEKEAAAAIEIARADADNGFDEHIPQEMEPEAAFVVVWKGAMGLIGGECRLEDPRIMEAGEEGKIVHRIPGYGVVPIDERGNLIWRAENVPEGEVFVNEATLIELKERLMRQDLMLDVGGLRWSEKFVCREIAKVTLEMLEEIIGVADVHAAEFIA